MTQRLLDKLLSDNAHWTPVETGFEVNDRFESWHVVNADLNQRHPHLASAMRLMYETDQELPSRNVQLLIETLFARIKFRTVGGDMVAITHFKEVKVSEGFVTVKGSGYCYCHKMCPLSGELLPIPLSTSSHMSLIPRDWFDMHHPGWKQRYQLALDLNCSPQEATEHMFIDVPTPSLEAIPGDLVL